MSAEAWAAIITGVFNLLALGILGLGLYFGNKAADREWDKALGRRPKEDREP